MVLIRQGLARRVLVVEQTCYLIVPDVVSSAPLSRQVISKYYIQYCRKSFRN